MAQQIIDTGAAANDGTGEPLRDAFDAVNDNFTEIYAAGPVGSNVVIANNVISVNGLNSTLVLAANGLGNIQANSSIMPSIDAVYDDLQPNELTQFMLRILWATAACLRVLLVDLATAQPLLMAHQM